MKTEPETCVVCEVMERRQLTGTIKLPLMRLKDVLYG